MLNDQEKNCLAHLLQTISSEEKLVSLAKSVSMGRIQYISSDDAIRYILLQTESLRSFFDRRKVNRDLLLAYLTKLNVSVAASATKETLVKHIFDVWKVPYSSSIPYAHDNVALLPSTHFSSLNPSLGYPQQQKSQDQILKEIVESEKIRKEAESMAFDAFILDFSREFYQLLNKKSEVNHYLHSLTTSHFIADCKMLIKIYGEEEETEVISENVTDTLENLSILQKQHELIFEPNLSGNEKRGHRDFCGLIHAVFGGCLYKRTEPVGNFKQNFVLRKVSSTQNSYIIDQTNLILISKKAVPYSSLMLTSGLKQNYHPAIEDVSDRKSF